MQGIKKKKSSALSAVAPRVLFSCWEMLVLLLALLSWRRATWRRFAPSPGRELCRARPARFSQRGSCLEAARRTRFSSSGFLS